MKLTSYSDKKQFLDIVNPFLSSNEVEYNLPLGILTRGINNNDIDEWLMVCVTDNDNIELVAIRTPNQKIIITSESNDPTEAINLLAKHVVDCGVVLPGVLGRKDLAEKFYETYSRMTGRTARLSMIERCYKLTKVNDVKLVGSMRLVDERDIYYLPYWLRSFEEDVFQKHAEIDFEGIKSVIEQKKFYVLEHNNMVVSLAGYGRVLPHGLSVGPVYTPPCFRGMGYATSCVAQLSAKILSDGYDYCVLYADYNYAPSNAVYLKVGYNPVSDSASFMFE